MVGGRTHQLAVFQFELTVVIEFVSVFLFVSRQDVVEGGLMLATLLPARERFNRDCRPPPPLLFDPVKQPTDVLASGETGDSSFQRGERGISCGDLLIPGSLFIKESVTSLFGVGFGLSRCHEFQLGQLRLLRGESGQSEEGGMELVHVGGWQMARRG